MCIEIMRRKGQSNTMKMRGKRWVEKIGATRDHYIKKKNSRKEDE